MSLLRKNFGCDGNVFDCISLYLKDRQLQVQVGGSLSSPRIFDYSFPLGSCLGPLLFNIYSSTVTDCITQGQDLGGYADGHYLRDSF